MTSGPLTRHADRRVLAGVAGGVAAYLNVPVLAVRAAFVGLSVAHGLGLAVYAVLWVFLPDAEGRTMREDRRAQGQLVGLLMLVGISMAVLGPLDLVPGGPTTAALLAAVAGIAVVWQQADAAQRQRWRSTATSSSSGLVRLGASRPGASWRTRAPGSCRRWWWSAGWFSCRPRGGSR